MNEKFLPVDCIRDVLLLFHDRCQSRKPPKAEQALASLKIEKGYADSLLQRAYIACVEEGLLELRAGRDSKNRPTVPSSVNIRRQRVLRVTSKGYRFLDESRSRNFLDKLQSALSTAGDAASIASVFAAFGR